MIEPVEAGKASNWDTLLASLAALCGGLAAWFYRKSGQVPRPDTRTADMEMFRRELQPILSRLDDFTREFSEHSRTATETNQKVTSLEASIGVIGERLSKVEGRLRYSGD